MALLNFYILNPSDSQQIFMDKCNANFDSVLSLSGIPGLTGLQGPQGIPGGQGITGPTGPQGEPGTQWFVQAGTPPISGSPTANIGDYWFDTTTLAIYQYNGTSWVQIGSLTTSNVFVLNGLTGEAVFQSPTDTSSLVLSALNYNGTDEQTFQYKLKVVSQPGAPSIFFFTEENEHGFARNWDSGAGKGENLLPFAASIILNKTSLAPQPTYTWQLDNPTNDILFTNEQPWTGTSNGLVIGVDGSFEFRGTTHNVYGQAAAAQGLTMDVRGNVDTDGAVVKGLSFGPTRTVFGISPTVNKMVFGYNDGSLEPLTITDYDYIGINTLTPQSVLDIVIPDALTIGAPVQPLLSASWDSGWPTPVGLLGTVIRLTDSTSANRSALRLAYASANLSNSQYQYTSSFLQFSENNYGMGVIKMGTNNTYAPGVNVSDSFYFFGTDWAGLSGYGDVTGTFINDNVDPSILGNVKWKSTLNVQTAGDIITGGGGSLTNIEDYNNTHGAIHLYQPYPLTANNFAGITSGGVDQYNTRMGILFQDADFDGAKVHVVTSAAGSTDLHNRLSVWGSGEVVHWSETAFSSGTDKYGLVLSTADHGSGSTSTIIRNVDLATGTGSALNTILAAIGTSTAGQADGHIIISPKDNMGFVAIGGESTFLDAPQTKFHLEGAATFGSRATIGTYTSDVGVNSFVHGTGVKNAGTNSIVLAGTGHAVNAGGFFNGYNVVLIGTQTTQSPLFGTPSNGVTVVSPYTTNLLQPTSILVSPISNTLASNIPIYSTRNLSVAPNANALNVNALTLTLPVPTVTGDERTNGIEVEVWIDNGIGTNRGNNIPLRVSLWDVSGNVQYPSDWSAANAQSSITLFSVDNKGITTINTPAFETSDTPTITWTTASNQDWRFTDLLSSLQIGPAPADNGLWPDAYQEGLITFITGYQNGAGSMTLAAARTTTSAIVIPYLTSPGLNKTSSRLYTSNIRTDHAGMIYGAPFEVFAGRTVNLSSSGSANVTGSTLKITAGDAESTHGINTGGLLKLWGGLGNNGGSVEVHGGASVDGSGAAGNVYIDAGVNGNAVPSINIGTGASGPSSGANININGSDSNAGPTVNVTGKVGMAKSPSAQVSLPAVSAAATNVTIIGPTDYDRFIYVNMTIDGGATANASFTFYVNGFYASEESLYIGGNNKNYQMKRTAQLLVPAGTSVTMDVTANPGGGGVDGTTYMNYVEQKLGL